MRGVRYIVLLITVQFHNFPNYLSGWLQAQADRIIHQLINSFSLHLAPPTDSVQIIFLFTRRRSLELGARRRFENVLIYVVTYVLDHQMVKHNT